MKIPKSEIPQADNLDDVVNVAYAVNDGARTFQDIAVFINKVDRQGRYYRLAAEILGLVRNSQNNSELTELGQELVSSDEQRKKEIVRSAVLGAHVFQRMIPFFDLHRDGATREQLESFVGQVTETTESMVHRRTSTLVSWLEKIELLRRDGDLYKINTSQIVTTPVLQFPDDEPLVPNSADLREYKTVQERAIRAGEVIQVMRDQAAFDRANATHTTLLNLVADRLRIGGVIPRNNRLVDLAAFVGDRSFLFEMKSTTNSNARSQVREGLSQLYEYRYLQNLPSATLVLVISDQLASKDSWIQEYLEGDRGVHLIWDGSNQLFASDNTKRELSILWR